MTRAKVAMDVLIRLMGRPALPKHANHIKKDVHLYVVRFKITLHPCPCLASVVCLVALLLVCLCLTAIYACLFKALKQAKRCLCLIAIQPVLGFARHCYDTGSTHSLLFF